MNVIEGAIDHWITNQTLNVQPQTPIFYFGQAPLLGLCLISSLHTPTSQVGVEVGILPNHG